MADFYLLDHFHTGFPDQNDLAISGQLQYHYSQSSQFDNPDMGDLHNYSQTHPTFPSDSMQPMNNIDPFTMEPYLIDDWNAMENFAGQILDPSQAMFAEFNPNLLQVNADSPSQIPYSLGVQPTLPISIDRSCAKIVAAANPSSSPSTRNNLSNNLCTPFTASGTAKLDFPPSSNNICICKSCDRTFPKQYLLNRHELLHNKPVRCPVNLCPHRTAKSRDMQRHIAAKHPMYGNNHGGSQDPRPLCPVDQCKHAQDGFARKDHLTRHIRRKHPERLR